VVTGVYACLAIFSLYSGYTTCVTDPIDQMLECHLAKKNSRSDDEESQFENNQHDPEDTKHCWVCQTSVQPKSLHCKFCNKCVARFDHHCQWLNTCVGERNYQLFFQTVIATFCFVGFHLGVNVYLVVGYYVEHGSVKEDIDGSYAGSVMIYPIIIFAIILALTLALIAQLLVFHISLQRQGITTYEYIVRHNAQNMEDKKEKDRLDLRRTAAIAVKKGKGESTFCLELGAHCKPCDPLQNEEETKEATAANSTTEKPRNSYAGRMSVEGMTRASSQELMRANSSGTNSRPSSLRNSKARDENSGQKEILTALKDLDEMEEVNLSRSGHPRNGSSSGGGVENTEQSDNEMTARVSANLSMNEKEKGTGDQITFLPIKSAEEEQKVELDRDDIMVNKDGSI